MMIRIANSLPTNPPPTDKIVVVLDDQIISPHQGGYQKFLVVGKVSLSLMLRGLQLSVFNV